MERTLQILNISRFDVARRLARVQQQRDVGWVSTVALLESSLEDYADYLAYARRRSPHTVRAYLTDVRSLIEFVAERGDRPLSLILLRAWLARQSENGAARTTLASAGLLSAS